MFEISVAMTTYNGEKFLLEQLQSILNQTLQPDEVVICDDMSCDNTVPIIQKFIDANKLENKWHLVINSRRKGCNQNFIDCAKMTTNELIFFSDQDDVWYPTKIEIMVRKFREYPNMIALCCNYDCINTDGDVVHNLSSFFADKRVNCGCWNVDFNNQIKFNQSAGLALALKKEILLEVSKFVETYELTYDLPIGVIASLYEGYFIIPNKLLSHRIHDNNSSKPSIRIWERVINIERQIDSNLTHIKQLKAVQDAYISAISMKSKNELEEAILITEKSILYLRKRNRFGSFCLMFKKNAMVNSWILINNFICNCFGKGQKK